MPSPYQIEASLASIGAMPQLTRVLFTVPGGGGTHAALANEITAVDTTSGSGIVDLPDAPAASTLNAVKQIILGASNTVTITCQGSDVINKSGGGTTQSLTLTSQGSLLHYNGSGIWTVLSDDLPLSQLEALFAQVANNLSDLASASAARTNLGLGTAAVLNTPIAASNLSGVVTGTGDASLVLTGTTLETATLDVIASLHPPAASVGMNGQRLTGLATPVNAADAATLAMARVLGQAGTQMVASGYVGALENFWQCPLATVPGTATWTAGIGYLWLMTVIPSATINGYLTFRWANAAGMANSYLALYNSSGTKLGATADQSSQSSGFKRVSAGFTTTPADGLIYVLYFNGTSGVAGGPYYMNNEWAQNTPALLPGWVAPGAAAQDTGSHSSVPSSITLANFFINENDTPYVAID